MRSTHLWYRLPVDLLDCHGARLFRWLLRAAHIYGIDGPLIKVDCEGIYVAFTWDLLLFANNRWAFICT